MLKTAKSDFLSSLPVEYRQYTWASLQVTEANRAALQSIRPNGITCYQPLGQKGSGSLYLYGTPGTGKTHLGVAIAQEICETHVCRYFSAKALKSQMQQAALGNAEWPDLVTPDLILFDDLEKINPTAYTYEWFFDALETRLNNRRGSIFTSQQRPGATALRLTPVDHEKLKAANGNPALLKEVEQERLLQAGALASRMSAGLKFEITGRDNRANH
ncbi:AAA family ATPase [Deinococcus misasensis]|uniref:AAA family ATPase n=1 Tax=Deinococcus misasensis TaxID=392413 RepID=UPI000A6322C8|nr:AAA family ATPase [Deinococcus misasensis]